MAAPMPLTWTRRNAGRAVAAIAAVLWTIAAGPGADSAAAQPAAPRLTLRQLVTPSARVETQGRLIRFALHGLIYFDTLDALFRHIDDEAGRWAFASAAERQAFADGLLRRGVESRVVSMETELPLELLLTHTRAEVEAAVTAVTGGAPVFRGRHWQLAPAVYRDAFARVRERWSRSLNCWSASPSLPGRVLSNWYVIDEGIELYGATYDSTEHFWQAVKYHPDVTIDEIRRLLAAMRDVEWRSWLDALAADQTFYFANAYAVEFLKRNLTRERLDGFDIELGRLAPATRARTAQQRGARASGAALAYTPLDEKVLWGDLADVFHLVVAFADRPGRPAPAAVAAVRRALVERQFDAVYVDGYGGGRVGFLSPEFQALMLEIWKVKFLRLPRFGEVLRSTAGVHLDHFLNDGDSPDIPIPVYVGYLNRIRDLAMETRK
jgi:hypothetical protein